MKCNNIFSGHILGIALGIIMLALILASGAGTVPLEQWNKTFGGAGGDFAFSVQQTSDGGYILAGYTDLYPAGGKNDAWLIKTDASGSQQWNRTFGGAGSDSAYSVQQTSDGGYILAGYTQSYGAGLTDAWLIKTDASGSQQWNKTFGGFDYDYAYYVQQTSDGGYILAGYKWSSSWDAWLIKTDASGSQQWNRTFGVESFDYDYAYSVQQTSDGGYILAGYTQSYGAGLGDAWLIKTDASGSQQWNKTFGKTSADYAYSVQQTSDGGYILAGYTESYGAGVYDAWLIKTDASGSQQWNRTFGGAGSDSAYSVQQISEGGYILAGSTWAGSDDNAWLIKTDANGSQQWNKTFGVEGFDYAYSVQQTSDGGYILVGYTESYGAGDAWLIKVASDAPSNNVHVAVLTDKPTYTPGETVLLNLSISNPTPNSYPSRLTLDIIWPTGTGMNVISKSFIMPPGFKVTKTIPYPIPNSIFIPDGDYSFNATLTYGSNTTSSEAAFVIRRP